MSSGQVDPDRLVTQTELADLRGVSRQYIHKLATQGRLEFIDGKMPLGDALAVLEDRPVEDDEDGPNFNQARTETEVWKGKKAKLDYQRDAGQLVRADRVEGAVFNAFFDLKNRVLEAMPNIARRCRAADTEREALALAEEAMAQVLGQISEALEDRWQKKAN
jgi:hypothetical protein